MYDDYRQREMTARETDIVAESMREFNQLQTERNVFAGQWEEAASLILPTSRNTFFYGNMNMQGAKKTDYQVDASGMLALSRFAAICDSLTTPRNMFWHGLQANDPYVMKDRQTKIWFDQVTKLLFKYRYQPIGNFSSQNQGVYQSLGAFGNGGLFIDEFDGTLQGGTRGIRYKSLPLGELFYHENHQGMVDGVCRWFRYTARQAWQKWGPDSGDNTFPVQLLSALQQNSETKFDFLHRICPRTDYDPARLDAQGKPYASYYICLASSSLLSDGGYRSFPMAIPRLDQTAGETYGRGPAQQVLPALKTLNTEKRTFLKQGHRAADPPLLTADDGLLGMSLRPGAINQGGMSADGKRLVDIIPTGDIQITKEMMADEKSLINDAFLVTLFQILTETPQMTATEVIERTNEKGILLAPTLGRLQCEYVGPFIGRELDILSSQRLLPPMPPRLKEAGGEYDVVHTSPLAKAAKAQEASGFYRTIEVVKEIVNVTQDASLLDNFDFDTALSEIADIQSVPPTWMASDEQKSLKRKARAEAQARQEQIQAAPAAAAMMKAQAVQAKSGMPQGQPQQGGGLGQPGGIG